jgi:hypothetical protein
MDKKMSYPMLGVGLQYSVIGKRMDMGHAGLPVTEMNGMDMIMPMVSISLPLYRSKYKHNNGRAVSGGRQAVSNMPTPRMPCRLNSTAPGTHWMTPQERSPCMKSNLSSPKQHTTCWYRSSSREKAT